MASDDETRDEATDEATVENRGLVGWLSDRLNLTEIFSLLTSYGLFFSEVDSSKPIGEALREALAKPSAQYTRGPRIFGLVVVVLLTIEMITGVLLSLYYLPTPESAHESVGTILRDVDFGWLVHQIHFWGAQLLIVVLIVRLIRFFVHRVFSPPRELFWVFAALLLLVCFHAELTGRILPWTSTAYWSGVRAMEVAQAVPIYGAVTGFLVGGETSFITELTLIRVYVLHVLFLPLFALTLIYLHFSGVRRVGLSEMEGEVTRAGADALRHHSASLAILFVVVFGVVVSLALLSPTTYAPAADPFATVPGIGPPWYLLAPFGFLELTSSLMPQWLAGSFVFLGFALFMLVPWVMRGWRRWVLYGVAGAVVVLWVALTLYGIQVV